MMLLEDRVGATAVLTLNYPKRRNALSMEMRGSSPSPLAGDAAIIRYCYY
jgi:enoyl-CoA hydratase/carnithine racemase